MNILFNRKLLCELNNHVDLENFIISNKIYRFFKSIPPTYVSKVNEEISKTDTLGYKNFKKWYRNIVNYPETIYNKNFLLCMGWNEDEVKKIISNKQKDNSKILSQKKLLNPELYYDKSPKRKEYWMKKGYSEAESSKIISESQKTFSLEICINKYGNKKGEEIFKKRQLKWVKSLKENTFYLENIKKQNPYKYDNKDIRLIIDGSSFLEATKKNIQDCIHQINHNEFVRCVCNKIDIKTFQDIIPYINSNIIKNHYKIDKNEIKKTFISEVSDNLQSGYYGTPVYYNGIRFKSIKEYKLCLLFEEMRINFIYEKDYPNSQFKSDFFLPDFNLFVEYFGILEGKNPENLDEKQLKYQKKMIDKILFCDENNINLIYDTKFDNLYKKLKSIL